MSSVLRCGPSNVYECDVGLRRLGEIVRNQQHKPIDNTALDDIDDGGMYVRLCLCLLCLCLYLLLGLVWFDVSFCAQKEFRF